MSKLRNEPGAPARGPATEPDGAPSRKPKKSKAPKSVTRKVGLTPAEKQTLDQLQQTCAEAGIDVSRRDLLRAALSELAAQPPAGVVRAWLALAPVKDKKAKK